MFVSFTQSSIFPGLQVVKFGCNKAACSWTENVSGDECGEGWEEAALRKEGGTSPGQGKGAATFWEST